MKDPEHHFITKALKRLRIWFSKKKRLMLQAQDLQRQLAEAWREKAQLKAENEALLKKLHGVQVYRRRSGSIMCKECFTLSDKEKHKDNCVFALPPEGE